MTPAPVLLAAMVYASFPTSVPEGEEPLVEVAKLSPKFRFDIRYATSDNFFGKKVYPSPRCLLRKGVGERMVAAQAWLDEHHPGLVLLFKDCYRPNRIQHVLWDAVKGTPKSKYVADPNTKLGSIHSYGAAVDLTLADAAGKELDMGTPYDFLGPLAEPKREAEFLAAKKLTAAHVANRKILREAMTRTGMRILPHEWWHFDAAPGPEVRKKYSRLDVPLEAVE